MFFLYYQWVKQEVGISLELYHVYTTYNKNILDKLKIAYIWLKIGINFMECPTCAYNCILLAGS